MRLQSTAAQAAVPQSASGAWPDTVAFREAIQNPHLALEDPELRGAEVVLDRRGLPLAYCGRFAVVFRLRTRNGEWALRCFTQAADDKERRERYSAVAARLAGGDAAAAPFVPFRYIKDGIRIGRARYPVVVMRWAPGETLGRFVEENLQNPPALMRLCAALTGLLQHLENEGISHGDWQHDNLLVSDGGTRLTLVDYDGMYVPALGGRPSPEIGHPNYQHPARTANDNAVGLDRFSCLVIQTALLALCRDPSLWERFNDGECLLFKRSDFADPALSPVFGAVEAAAGRDTVLCACLRQLETACVSGREGILLAGGPLLAGHPTSPKWWVAAEEPRSFRMPSLGEGKRRRWTPLGPPDGYAARLDAPKTLWLEAQHHWVLRAGCGAITGSVLYTSSASTDSVYVLMGALLNLMLLACGYDRWPRKKIHDALLREIGQIELKVAERDRTMMAKRTVMDALNEATLSGSGDFVARELRKVPINRAVSLGGIGLVTLQRLREAGIHTAADVTDQRPVAGVSPHQITALKNWQRDLEIQAANRLNQISLQRRNLQALIDQLEQEKAGHQRACEELQRQNTQFPDTSVGLFVRTVLGLK